MILSRLTINIRYIFIALLTQLVFLTPLNADPQIRITSGRAEPFVTPQHKGFYDLIVKHMFQRVGLEATTIVLPSERSLINANTGEDDGNIARIKGIEKKYTNLIMVPEKVIDFDFVAFTKNEKFMVENWQSLKPYNVAYINGWKVFEKKVKHYKSVVKTRDSKQLFHLLEKGRADIVLYDLWSGLWQLNQEHGAIDYLKPPIATFKLYLYVNKKHQKIVPLLAAALKDMKQDGTYKKIYDDSLNILLN